MRDVVVAADPAAVAALVADAFLARMAAAQDRGETPEVALTGGTVARLVHREIAARAHGYGVDWSRIEFWFGDERFVAPDSPDRNAGQAREDFLDVVGATRVREVADTTTAEDVDAAASSYAAEVRASDADEFDLVMLGMGPDGHIASLFPGFPQLDLDEIAVGVTGSPKPPPERVSLALPALNRSRAVWFLVTGAEKAEATRRAWAFDGSIHETPARGIIGPSVTWYVDEAAAGAAAAG
jgi:6-phosphogluconolactonase